MSGFMPDEIERAARTMHGLRYARPWAALTEKAKKQYRLWALRILQAALWGDQYVQSKPGLEGYSPAARDANFAKGRSGLAHPFYCAERQRWHAAIHSKRPPQGADLPAEGLVRDLRQETD
jgi:hypothetical protein